MLKRFFGKNKKASDEPERVEVPINHATIGLCFNFDPGIDYVSESLSDLGLDHILKILEARQLRATFNCPAKLCETIPEQLQRIAEQGHEIAVMGYANESPKELTVDAIKQLLFACRRAFTNLGLSPSGFRAPNSQWDERLSAELARQQFRYNAEHDHAKNPYVLNAGPPTLFRVPIRTDDRGLRRSENTYNLTVSKHLRLIRRAARENYFVSICFHPWILAEDMERLEHWELWLNSGLKAGAKMVALEDVLPPPIRAESSHDAQ